MMRVRHNARRLDAPHKDKFCDLSYDRDNRASTA